MFLDVGPLDLEASDADSDYNDAVLSHMAAVRAKIWSFDTRAEGVEHMISNQRPGAGARGPYICRRIHGNKWKGRWQSTSWVPSAEALQARACKMSGSASGLDGWETMEIGSLYSRLKHIIFFAVWFCSGATCRKESICTSRKTLNNQ